MTAVSQRETPAIDRNTLIKAAFRIESVTIAWTTRRRTQMREDPVERPPKASRAWFSINCGVTQVWQ